MDFEAIARQTAVGQQKCDDPGCHTAAGQEECDDPDCACHPGTGQPQPGDGAAEVTMTEVYDIDIPWGHHPSGW